MPLSKFKTYKLNSATDLGVFDCEDDDLNDFYYNKCKHFQLNLLATTFVVIDHDNNKTVAFFSIFNDNLPADQGIFKSKSEYQRFKKIFPFEKRFLSNYPALKIGRLGVSKEYKGKSIGTAILNSIIMIALKANDNHACKFITLDAYAKSINFYLKNDFKFLTDRDENDDTRQMYFDLTPFYDEDVKNAV